MPQMLNSNVLSWAPDADGATLAQAARCASMPFVKPYVALMADGHLGKGATIGSVIPTEGAIIPAAVGVDLGCVDPDTEYLSPSGWQRIADYSGGKVMGYDPTSGSGEFVTPLDFIRRPSNGFLHFRTRRGINQMLSPDHRVLCYQIVGRDRRRELVVTTAGEIAADHNRLKLGAKVEYITTFTPYLDTTLPLSDAALRVQVMLMADGAFGRGNKSHRVVVGFTKKRKITRAIELLTSAGIKYSKRIDTEGTTRITFLAPVRTKTYADLWNASLSQLEIITDEVFHWDGNFDGRVFYTRDEDSADFIQYAFTATGRRSVKRLDGVDYRVYAYERTTVGLRAYPKSSIQQVSSPDGYEYCFTMPTGFWIMRRGGNIVATGNCGMIATQFNLTATDLPDDLSRLHSDISRRVPAGVGQGHKTDSYGVTLPKDLTDAWDQKIKSKVGTQFGTLGSGNHFVEVCLDENDNVWAVLHSGSRGPGNLLAQWHINKAKGLMKKYMINVPDPDLAYFVKDTPEFQAYMSDVDWASEFAFGSRQAMMDQVHTAVSNAVGRKVESVQTINCHHNYVAREHHGGKNIWVTRKGAVRAREGDLGIIPGSMGAETFIVKGTGAANSFHSCSHGAGRTMSRSAAKRALTVESLFTKMEGKAWNVNAEALLDEHPDAYKDIRTVMENQKDLVTIQHTLTQVLNYKGV